MRIIILVLVTVLSFNLGTAQLENDKVLHFAGGALFGLAGAGIAKEISDGNRYWTFAGAVGGALLVGIGKEAVDSGQEGNRWDNGDVLATALGGVAVGFTIDIFTGKKRRNRAKTAALKYDKNFNVFSEDSLPTWNQLKSSTAIVHTE
jgi:uncharacterized protein YfiM (DUF2279 family)